MIFDTEKADEKRITADQKSDRIAKALRTAKKENQSTVASVTGAEEIHKPLRGHAGVG